MSTNSILINFAGYPGSLRTFYLDNGLANLAACLLEKGHKTAIYDYATVDSVKYLYPYKYKEDLLNSMGSINKSLKQGRKPDSIEIEKFHSIDKKIEKYKYERIKDIAYELGNDIQKNKIDFVGFKLWTGEGFIGSMIIAKELRKRFPGLYIFAGGPQVDWFGKAILDACPAFDLLVYGEGEETIAMLADYVKGKVKLAEIPNLIYRKNGHIITTFGRRVLNLDDLPAPVYDPDVYLSNKDNQKIKIISIEECRGCPNFCNFCVHPIKSGPRWRLRNPEKLVKQIEELMNRHNTTVFKFSGSNPPPEVKIRVAEEVIKRKISVKYSGFGHVKGMTLQDYELLKESGCKSMFFGVESGSQKILEEVINKKFTVNEVKQAISDCKKAGIAAVASVIVPMPGETEKTKQDTIDLLVNTQPDIIFVNFPSLQYCTKWAIEHEKFGFKIDNREKFFYQEMMYTMNNLYPSVLWKDISEYELNGKSFKQVISESEDFARVLKQKGLLPYGSDDLFLLADSSKKFFNTIFDKSKGNLLNGDHDDIKKMVEKLNNKIQKED